MGGEGERETREDAQIFILCNLDMIGKTWDEGEEASVGQVIMIVMLDMLDLFNNDKSMKVSTLCDQSNIELYPRQGIKSEGQS